MSTCTHVPSITGPKGIIGVGGTGGGPLGGCAGCACGIPSASEVKRAAGKEGNALAMESVAVANPSLSRLTALPGNPTTAPIPPATLWRTFVGRGGKVGAGAGGRLTGRPPATLSSAAPRQYRQLSPVVGV